jgi:hypothetical protein
MRVTRFIRILVPALLIVAGFLRLGAQEVPREDAKTDALKTEALKKETLPDKVAALGDLRRRLLLRDKPKTEQELQDLKRKSEEASFAREQIARLERELQELRARNDPRAADMKSFLDARKARVDELRKTDFAGETKKKESQLAEIETSLAEIERTIDKLLDPEVAKQNFKLIMSSVFAFLVALVIGGFFYVARTDETVRRAMFSGQAGIQFVTLFSLVIAIILFGITAILEGKELSALLGGLSGYILGRTTGERSQGAGG